MNTTASILLIIDPDVTKQQISPFLDDLTSSKIDAVVIRRESQEIRAVHDWLIPSAVVLDIAKPYFETLLEKMAEDHYPILKKAVANQWRKFFGPEPEIKRQLYGKKGMIKESIFSMSFSTIGESVHGTKLTLLFLNDTTLEDCELACEKFYRMLFNHHFSLEVDSLSVLLESREKLPTHSPEFIYLDPKSKKLVLIDPVQSSIQETLIGDEIPEP